MNQSVKETGILPDSENSWSNVLQFPAHVDSFDYIISFKAGSAEMLLLSREFESPKAGSALKYLCYMAKKHQYNPLGFAWPVFTSNRADGKSIAAALKINARNTIYKTLKDIRVEYKFLRGEGKVDCSTIDYQGKYFASYHHAKEHKVYWFPNYAKLGALANRIADDVANLRGKNGPAKTFIKLSTATSAKPSGNTSIETSTDTLIDTSFLKEVGVGIGVEVVVNVEEEGQFPTVTNSLNGSTNPMGLVGKTVNQEITENIGNYSVPPRSIKTLYDAWANAMEVTYGEKGLYPKKEDYIQTKNLRCAFAQENAKFSLEQMVTATVTDWADLKKVLQSYPTGWQIKNQKCLTIPQIQAYYSQVLTWYSNKLHTDEMEAQVKAKARKEAVERKEYLKANPPPKQGPCTAGYTYFHGKKLTFGGARIDKTWEEDAASYINSGASAEQVSEVLKHLKEKPNVVDIEASLNMVNKLVSEGFMFDDDRKEDK